MGKKIDVNNLSADARQVLDSKKVSGKNKLKDWFIVLMEAAAFDEAGDALRAKYGKRAILFLILSIVFLFLAFFTVGITLILFVPSVILTIVYFVKKSRLGKIDLDNEFREVLIPFLQTISEDIHGSGRIKMDLDLAGPVKEKIVRKEEIPPGRFRKVIETVYEDPWCQVEVPLVDGSRLILNIDNTYITYDRYWRNPRGKSKHKTKWKKLVTATAGIAPDDRFDFDSDRANDMAAGEKLKFADKKGLEIATLTRKFKFKAVNAQPGETIGPDALLAMFFQLGSMLQPSSETGSGS